MKNLRTKISIIKSNDPEKLVVFQAASLENEIRFYLNDTQYYTAMECKEGCIVKFGEDALEKAHQNESLLSVIKANLKDFIAVCSIFLGIAILGAIVLSYLGAIMNNVLMFLIIMNIAQLMVKLVSVVLIETTQHSPSIKSKHSAEHMMVNFLQLNKRLPRNIEEVKQCSRFSTECGSKDLIEGFAEQFISNTIAIFFAILVSIILGYFSFNSVTNSYIIAAIFLIAKYLIGNVITKCGSFRFVIEPMEKALTNIAQSTNTTRRVNDKDIILAYCAAKPWLETVYPEFYNESDDFLWEHHLKEI